MVVVDAKRLGVMDIVKELLKVKDRHQTTNHWIEMIKSGVNRSMRN